MAKPKDKPVIIRSQGPENGSLFDLDEYDSVQQEWQGMPTYHHAKATPLYQLLVNFASLDDLVRFGETIGQRITPGMRSIWFPEAEIGRYADKVYAPESEVSDLCD